MPTITADGIYYVDLGDDPLFGDGSFRSVYPENCEFSGAIREAGEISFQLSFSSRDQDGNPSVIRPVPPEWVPFIGPYRSYYRLRCGDVAIQAGPVTNTNSTRGSGFMSITGKTWEHYFERWQYPFDGRSDHVQDFQFANTFVGNELGAGSGVPLPGTGLAYQANNRDVIYIWSDIMAQMMNSVPYRQIFDISALAHLSTINTNYQLALGDTTYLFELVNQLAGTGEGFDWWIGWDKKVHWGAPYRFGPTSAPVIMYNVTSADEDSGFLSPISFTNNGPTSTHTLGTGSGLATQTRLARAYGYGPAQVEFTRLDAAYDFGDVRNVAQLASKSRKQLSQDLQPVHEIPLTLDPRHYPSGLHNFWSTWRVGRAVYLTMDMYYHHIDSAQQLKSYSARLNNNGDCELDWTLSQIYDTDPDTGTAEG